MLNTYSSFSGLSTCVPLWIILIIWLCSQGIFIIVLFLYHPGGLLQVHRKVFLFHGSFLKNHWTWSAVSLNWQPDSWNTTGFRQCQVSLVLRKSRATIECAQRQLNSSYVPLGHNFHHLSHPTLRIRVIEEPITGGRGSPWFREAIASRPLQLSIDFKSCSSLRLRGT